MLVSVTRLRLRSIRYLPSFVRYAAPSYRQTKQAPGAQGLHVKYGGRLVFWTMTGWDDLASMRAYRNTGPHQVAMRYLSGWCDEASYVHWETPHPTLPDWTAAFQRMAEDGIPSHVKHPSPTHTAAATKASQRLTASG